MRDRSRPGLERLPILIVVAVGMLLVAGVLVATSTAEQRDSPAWYPRTNSLVPPRAETSAPEVASDGEPSAPVTVTGRPGPSTEEDPITIPTGSGPTTAPATTNVAPTGSGGREGSTDPGWRLVGGLPPHRGALSDVDVITVAGQETFVAAGADQHGALVLASNGPDSWRELRREGLPREGYARAVAATQNTIMVAGADASGPAVWELADDSWRRASMDGAVEGRAVFADVAVRRDTWVVVGYDGDGTGFWVRTPEDERFAAVDRGAVMGSEAEDVLVRAVVATDAGFVAVGQAGGRAVRWSSADGVRWTGEELVAGDNATAIGVAADGETIVGYDGSGGVLWAQRSGERHSIRLPPPSDAPQTAETVATRSSHTVVIGVEAGSVRCWELNASEQPPERCEHPASLVSASSIGAVVAHRGGLLAVGQVQANDSRGIGIWTFNDE